MTIQEKVHEAGDAAIRSSRQDPNYHRIPQDREDRYRAAADPKSDWPEAALTGEHLQQVLHSWMPDEPVSPGRRQEAAQRHRSKGKKGTAGTDAVSGINKTVGHQPTAMERHGNESTATNQQGDASF